MLSTHRVRTLFVGGLCEELEELTLYEKFLPFGPVVYARIDRDPINAQSMGYAFVKFLMAEDAERAYVALQGTPVLGRPMRLMFKNPEAFRQIRYNPNANALFLDPSRKVSLATVVGVCRNFGEIVNSNIALDEQGQSKGFGFIQFASSEAAKSAVRYFSGNWRTPMDSFGMGKQFAVAPIEPIQPYQIQGTSGAMYDARSGVRPVDPNPRQEAQASYASSQLAKPKRHDTFVARRRPRINRHNSLECDCWQLYVSCFPLSFRNYQLRKLFQRFGSVAAFIVLNDRVSTGYGFVCFGTWEDATNALRMHNKNVQQNILNVTFTRRSFLRLQQLVEPSENISPSAEAAFNYKPAALMATTASQTQDPPVDEDRMSDD
uniref:RRM domain-containing protein n=1 Tax=Anopheles farauti TaxID=69004 RepID=A0A182Q689_9DIPT